MVEPTFPANLMTVSWVPVCRLAALIEQVPLRAEVNGHLIVLVLVSEGLFALADECSHAQVRLSLGAADGCYLECFAHGAWFDLRTGQALGPQATGPVRSYRCRVRDGIVEVNLGSEGDSPP